MLPFGVAAPAAGFEARSRGAASTPVPVGGVPHAVVNFTAAARSEYGADGIALAPTTTALPLIATPAPVSNAVAARVAASSNVLAPDCKGRTNASRSRVRLTPRELPAVDGVVGDGKSDATARISRDTLHWMPTSFVTNNEKSLSMHDEPLLAVRVECYAGHRGEQTPRVLTLGDRRIIIADVIDAWLAPEYRYFKLRGADANTYLVRHDERSNTWELTMFQRPES